MGHVWFGKVLPKIVKPIEKKPVRVLTSVVLDNTLYASYIIATGVFFFRIVEDNKCRECAEEICENLDEFSGILDFNVIDWS